jgi:hypothetical protein
VPRSFLRNWHRARVEQKPRFAARAREESIVARIERAPPDATRPAAQSMSVSSLARAETAGTRQPHRAILTGGDETRCG